MNIKNSLSRSKKSSKKSRKSKSRLAAGFINYKKHIVALPLVAVLFLGGIVYAHRPGPLNAALSHITGNPPLVQADTTKLLTVNGLADNTNILVKFRSSASASTIAAIHSQSGGQVKKTIPGIGVQLVSLPTGTAVGDALNRYRSHAEVAYAEPDFLVQRFFAPNDSLYSQQWNLAKISAPTAWDVSQGGYGPIAVIDTGIDAAHADLAGEVTSGYNFVNDSTDTSDDNGHGTHVAGIIAGQTNNTVGVASIGFKGSLMPVKVLDSTGAGTYSAVSNGIIYAADHGASIINMSLGGSSNSQTLASAVSYAEQKGVIVVAAAGNNANSAAVYPADYPGVIAVSATTDSDGLASFSSYGSDVYVSAPGVNITSTYFNGGYATMSGTSMAAPEVAGLIGLALSHAGTSASTVLDDLKLSSDKIGSYSYDSNGWNQYFGYGRLNAGKLLQMISGSQPTAPTPTPTPATQEGQTVHGQTSQQFSVDFEGTVDSTQPQNNIVVVKVQSISQNLKLADSNLVNVYLDQNSVISQGNQTLSLADLTTGSKLSGKALWQNNKLTATTLNVQGRQDTTNSNSHKQKL